MIQFTRILAIASAIVSEALLASSPVAKPPSTPIILISVDTLRADYLGCYRSSRQITPHIDSIAKNGTLFEQTSALVPLTLPSHVALLTSTYPFTNGVEDNGHPLADGTATLAAVLKFEGYRTAAFVGSFVLDRRFGLSTGFDVYDSPFDLHNKAVTDVGDLKRRGSQVTAAAIRWLDLNADAAFFLFLHLYDLHTPYDLPPDQRSRRSDIGYERELAYIDGLIGQFLADLERRGLLNKSLIVFTSDHGEGLKDHGESAHGYFLYDSTLHVPLIFRWPGKNRSLKQEHVVRPVSLIDVAPTILQAVGVRQPATMQGRSLIAPNGQEEQIYSESLYAQSHFGCAPLRSVRVGRYKYIDAPSPEFYDLSNDPGELHNIWKSQPALASEYGNRLRALLSNAPKKTSTVPSAETVNALRSLGYLSGSSAASRLNSHIDPKDRILDFERFGQARSLASAGRLSESNSLLEQLANKLPDVADIRISLGLNLQRARRYPEAAQEFKRAIDRDPLNAQAHFDLAMCQVSLKRFDDAIGELKAALSIEPWYTRASELLADVYLQKKDFVSATSQLQTILSVEPRNYLAHYNLGVLAAMSKRWDEAQTELALALQTDPTSAEAHNTLGSMYLQRGNLESARGELERAIRLQADFAWAHYNLALVSEKEHRLDEAVQELQLALKSDPRFETARAELARIDNLNKH